MTPATRRSHSKGASTSPTMPRTRCAWLHCAITDSDRAIATLYSRSRPLQRAQEIEDVLLLALPQEEVEVLDDLVRFRRVIVEQSPTLMSIDRFQQVGRPSVVQEKNPLSQAPQRRGPELPGSGLPLSDPIGQPRAHVMKQQI